jgi:acyl-CoA thioester hydrolase
MLPGVTDHAIPHSFPVPIDPADIDFMGHVNNASYLKWVQEAVLSHWRKIAPAEAVASLLWVALKHEITYRKPTFLDDEVIATVLLEKVQGARAFYQTIIKRGEDVLAEVKSSWCCVDAETLRPARLASSVVDKFFTKAD